VTRWRSSLGGRRLGSRRLRDHGLGDHGLGAHSLGGLVSAGTGLWHGRHGHGQSASGERQFPAAARVGSFGLSYLVEAGFGGATDLGGATTFGGSSSSSSGPWAATKALGLG
jgi:hypothetical protein